MPLKRFPIILGLICCISCSTNSKQTHEQTKAKSNSTNQSDSIAIELDQKIWVVYQDREDNYWFGSNGKGIYRYDGKTLTRYTTKHGLIDNAIRGIQQDQSGNVLIETPSGVSRFDGRELSNIPVTNNGKEVLIISIYQDNHGTIWLGTDNDGIYKQNGEGFEKFTVSDSYLVR